MSKLRTVEDYIIQWLFLNNKTVVTSGELKDQCWMWMVKEKGFEGNLCIDRAFRKLKQEPDPVLRCENIGNRKHGKWKILEFRGKPWDRYVRSN